MNDIRVLIAIVIIVVIIILILRKSSDTRVKMPEGMASSVGDDSGEQGYFEEEIDGERYYAEREDDEVSISVLDSEGRMDDVYLDEGVEDNDRIRKINALIEELKGLHGYKEFHNEIEFLVVLLTMEGTAINRDIAREAARKLVQIKRLILEEIANRST